MLSSRLSPSRQQLGRVPLLALGMFSLLVGMWAGLVRLGIELPELQPDLSLAHGPLMVSGFLGVVIGLERAVAIGAWSAYAAPVLAACGAVALIVGAPVPAGAILLTGASLALAAVQVEIVRRQPTRFNMVIGLGAGAWLAGNCLWTAGVPIDSMVFWWGAFMVLTILGERLELTRLSRPKRYAGESFVASVAIYVAGMILASLDIAGGIRVMAVGMVAMAGWLLLNDVVRRTIRERGLPRFIAANLLLGYLWLAASGIFWFAFAPTVTLYQYDAMVHGLFLGFVFSMIFAHAPIIFPSVLVRPFVFRRAFYLHTALLHASLLVRVGAGDLTGSFRAYQWGGMLNVLALVVFVVNTGGSLAGGRLASARSQFSGRREGSSIRPHDTALPASTGARTD